MDTTTTTSEGTYLIQRFTKYVLPGLFLSWTPNLQRIAILFDYTYLGYHVISSKSIGPWDYYLSWIRNPYGVPNPNSYIILHSP